jgi:hypothetical protein
VSKSAAGWARGLWARETRAPGLIAGGFGFLAVFLVAFVAFAGDSAAVPGLGPATAHPPWDANLHLSSGLVTVLLIVAYLSGGLAVGLGLIAVRNGGGPRPRVVLIASLGAVIMLSVLPPLGSADHLSYLAYGRIAAAGDDPYVVDPLEWHGGTDPVASAIRPPWQHTRSVYGPVTTAAQALVSWLGHGSLRLTVWFWQLLTATAFLLIGFVLDRIVRQTRPTDRQEVARARVAVLWTLNPLLLSQLVLGGHVDVLAVAAAIGAIALVARRPALAGLLLGAAVGSKVTFGLFALALLWGLRRLPRAQALRSVVLVLLGALVVLVPAHLWSGPHTYAQLRQASRLVSLATPWRLVVDHLATSSGFRSVLGPLALALGALLAILLSRRMKDPASHDPASQGLASHDLVTRDAATAAVLLSAAWVLTTPYALPWYDSMVWAPLTLLAASSLDLALLIRLTVLAIGYAPGRVEGMSEQVERLTLDFRRNVVPWLTLAVLLAVIKWGFRSAGRPEVPAPARLPQ